MKYKEKEDLKADVEAAMILLLAVEKSLVHLKQLNTQSVDELKDSLYNNIAGIILTKQRMLKLDEKIRKIKINKQEE